MWAGDLKQYVPHKQHNRTLQHRHARHTTLYVGVLRVQPGRALYDATGSKPQAHCVSYALKCAIQEHYIIFIAIIILF